MVVARHQPRSELAIQWTPPVLHEPPLRLARAQTLRLTAAFLLPLFLLSVRTLPFYPRHLGPLRGGTPTAIMQAERRRMPARRPAVSRSAVLNRRRTRRADLLRQVDNR